METYQNDGLGIDQPALTVFVPSTGKDRRETAKFLVDTADKNDIDQRHIRANPSGFYISDALADIVYDEPDEDPQTPDEAPAPTGSTTK